MHQHTQPERCTCSAYGCGAGAGTGSGCEIALLETLELEKSFRSFRVSMANSNADNHAIYASDLVAALGVTLREAEEMIFIADLKDNQAIDFTEFKQVVVNWSG